MNAEQIHLISGNLFDAVADIMVIPCSTAGTISSSFRLGLERTMGYRFQDDLGVNPPGSTVTRIYQKSPRKQAIVIFAVAVDEASSTLTIIETLADTLIRVIASYHDIGTVAMPLIGAGAGGLDGLMLYETWHNRFLASELYLELYIYVHEKNIFERIRSNFELKSIKPSADNKLYLVELEEETLLERFYNESIWINTSKNAVPLVKQMEQGAPLIVKQYIDSEDGNGILVRAAGTILRNYADGEKLDVYWDLKNIELPIKTSHLYNRSVARVGSTNGAKILRKIKEFGYSEKANEKSVPAPEVLYRSSSKIAPVLADNDQGVDHLDIKKDYIAFAKLIAAKDFIPPLSVALLGKWGSGKSFFMRKLSAQIADYEGKENFCSGIVQIHFNAWSYMDANLWASMVSRIFEGLYSYVAGLDASDTEKLLITKGLNEQLTITSDELSKINQEKVQLVSQIKDLEIARKNYKNLLESQIEGIKVSTFKKALQQVNTSFKVSDQLSAVVAGDYDIRVSMEKINELIPREYLENPEEAYQKAKSSYTFLKAFFAPKKMVNNLFFVGAILLLIWLMPIMVTKVIGLVSLYIVPYIQSTLFLIAIATPVIIRFKNTYKEVAPVVSAFWKIRKDYQEQVEIARSEVEQHQRATELLIATNQAEIKTIDVQLSAARENLASLTFRKDHAIATEALYSFIEKRCNSGEYQKHLGIVSIIRKDFEILSNLFVDHQKEVIANGAALDEDIEAFRSLFKKPLERIVLYIDDLDRCPEERVVEVLEAVNLLMAFPLFVVVVGIDPRWVKKALDIRYHKLFTEESGPDQINASDYLEKIFQVPFHLKEASDIAIKNMLVRLINVPDEEDEYAPSADKVFKADGGVEDRWSESPRDNGQEFWYTGVSGPQVSNILKTGTSPFLKLTTLERELIQQMSGILGPNPRAIKRFVNIYKIVRSHEGLEYFVSEERNSFLMMMFLLAVYNGQFRQLSLVFDELITKNRETTGTIMNFLTSPDEKSNHDPIKTRFHKVLQAMPDGSFFLEKGLYEFHELNKLIRRFCFSI